MSPRIGDAQNTRRQQAEGLCFAGLLGMAKYAKDLQPGDHVCVVYSTPRELASVVADFLAEGLRRGEQCWYVAAAGESQAVRTALRRRRVDVTGHTRRGALSLVAGSQSYIVRGGFDPELTVQVFNDAIEQALKDGFRGFRAAADMSWALGIANGADQLIAYEALLRSLFATCRVTGLCLYDQGRMPLKVLNGALVTHPIAGTGSGEFTASPFYEPAVAALPEVDEAAVHDKLRTLKRITGQESGA